MSSRLPNLSDIRPEIIYHEAISEKIGNNQEIIDAIGSSILTSEELFTNPTTSHVYVQSIGNKDNKIVLNVWLQRSGSQPCLISTDIYLKNNNLNIPKVDTQIEGIQKQKDAQDHIDKAPSKIRNKLKSVIRDKIKTPEGIDLKKKKLKDEYVNKIISIFINELKTQHHSSIYDTNKKTLKKKGFLREDDSTNLWDVLKKPENAKILSALTQRTPNTAKKDLFENEKQAQADFKKIKKHLMHCLLDELYRPDTEADLGNGVTVKQRFSAANLQATNQEHVYSHTDNIAPSSSGKKKGRAAGQAANTRTVAIQKNGKTTSLITASGQMNSFGEFMSTIERNFFEAVDHERIKANDDGTYSFTQTISSLLDTARAKSIIMNIVNKFQGRSYNDERHKVAIEFRTKHLLDLMVQYKKTNGEVGNTTNKSYKYMLRRAKKLGMTVQDVELHLNAIDEKGRLKVRKGDKTYLIKLEVTIHNQQVNPSASEFSEFMSGRSLSQKINQFDNFRLFSEFSNANKAFNLNNLSEKGDKLRQQAELLGVHHFIKAKSPRDLHKRLNKAAKHFQPDDFNNFDAKVFLKELKDCSKAQAKTIENLHETYKDDHKVATPLQNLYITLTGKNTQGQTIRGMYAALHQISTYEYLERHVHVHCKSGKDRTSMWIAAHLAQKQYQAKHGEPFHFQIPKKEKKTSKKDKEKRKEQSEEFKTYYSESLRTFGLSMSVYSQGWTGLKVMSNPWNLALLPEAYVIRKDSKIKTLAYNIFGKAPYVPFKVTEYGKLLGGSESINTQDKVGSYWSKKGRISKVKSDLNKDQETLKKYNSPPKPESNPEPESEEK